MKTMEKTLLISGILAVSLLPPSLFARSQSAYLGYPEIGREAGCFNLPPHSEGVLQVCSETKHWVMPLVYDNAGRKSVQIFGRNNGASQITCRAASADQHVCIAKKPDRHFGKITIKSF